VGELRKLGIHNMGRSTLANILKAIGSDPEPQTQPRPAADRG
jgi:hypothetical protein